MLWAVWDLSFPDGQDPSEYTSRLWPLVTESWAQNQHLTGEGARQKSRPGVCWFRCKYLDLVLCLLQSIFFSYRPTICLSTLSLQVSVQFGHTVCPGEDIQYNRYLRKYTSRWMQRAPQSCLSPGPTSWSLCTPKQPSLHTAKFRIVVNDTHPSTISTVFSDTTRENARVPELDFQEQTGVSSQIDQGSWTVDNEISLSWRWLHSSSENAITKQSNSTLLLCRQWTGCRFFFLF